MSNGAPCARQRDFVRFLAVILALLLAAAPAAGQTGVFIDSVAPDVLAPGQSATLLMEGEGFAPGCEVEFAPSAVQAQGLHVLSPSLMEVDVVVSPGAQPGDVTILYTLQGITTSFDGLLEIRGMPQIAGINPTQLSGPQSYQQLEVSGQFFSEQWVDGLGITAVMASGNLGYDLNVSAWLIDAAAFGIELETPEEYYADPCSIFIEISDPLTGIISSFQIPVEIKTPETKPVVDSILFEPDGALVLGNYPVEVTGTLLVEGSGLGLIDPATLRVTGHKLTHLTLPSSSNPKLSEISVSDTEISADFLFRVTGDDRSFAAGAAGSAMLRFADLAETFSYGLELSWPPPRLDQLELESSGVISGVISGDTIVLSGEEVQISATLAGDYLRDVPDTSLLLSCNICDFNYGYNLSFGPDGTTGVAAIAVTPISLTQETEQAPFQLELSMGGSTLVADVNLPVELTQVVPEVHLVSAAIEPAGPLAQPDIDSCLLRLEFSGSNLDMLDFATDSIELGSAQDGLVLQVGEAESADIGPGAAVITYPVSLSAPDVTDTALGGRALTEISVVLPVSVRYQEYSELFDATFYSDGACALNLSYPPGFTGVELAGDPRDLGGSQFSVPLVVSGVNLLPKYLEAAEGFVEAAGASGSQLPLDSLMVSDATSGAITVTAAFDLSALTAADPAPREETLTLSLAEAFGGSVLTTGEFDVHLGLAPLFSGLEVSSPGIDVMVGPQFAVEFVVDGEHLLPQYFEGAAASLQIIEPQVQARFELGAVELQSATGEVVEGVIPVNAAQFDAGEPVLAELTLKPAVSGAPVLRGEFVLDLVLKPLVRSVQVAIDDALVLPDEIEFVLLFQIGGEHFRAEYFEDLAIVVEPLSPLPGGAHIIAASPEITSMSPTSAAGTLECALADAEQLAATEIQLRCTPTASALQIPGATALLKLEPGSAAPQLRFSVPGPATLWRVGGAALLELPLATSVAAPQDLPVHGEVQLASGDSLEFDFELSAGRRLSESFSLPADSTFAALLASRSPGALADSAGPLTIELTSPDLPDFRSVAGQIPCEVMAPLALDSVEVLDAEPAELDLADPAGLQLRIVVEGDNLDTAALSGYTRFNPDGIPVRAKLNVESASFERVEATVLLIGQDVLELAEDLEPGEDEIEAEFELRGTSISGEVESITGLYRLLLPPAASPRGLELFVDDGQQLYTITRGGAAVDAPLELQLELTVQYLSADGPVRNIRGLRFDSSAAEDAFFLRLDGSVVSPAEVRRRTESLLALTFEVPRDALAATGATPASLLLEPEDLAFAYDPLLAAGQRTLEFPLSLRPVGTLSSMDGSDVAGGGGTEAPGSPEMETRIIDLTASASAAHAYSVENIALEFVVPASRSPRPEHDHIGPYNFSVVNELDFAGVSGVGSGERSFSLDPETGQLRFGNGETGRRLPAGDVESGDLPELTVEVQEPDAELVLLVPLYNPAAQPELAVGVSTDAYPVWPAGWEQVGDAAELQLEPWSDYGAPGAAQLLPADAVQVEFALERLTPQPEDGTVRGGLLFAELSWQLLSNVQLSQVAGWTFGMDRSVAGTGLLPVGVSDSDAGGGASAPARSGGANSGNNENWNFEGCSRLAGRLLSGGQAAGEYHIELELDGTAVLTADLRGLSAGQQFELELPPRCAAAPTPDTNDQSPFFKVELDTAPQPTISISPDSTQWSYYTPVATNAAVDCAAAVEELERLEGEDGCDCSAEEQALAAAADALRQAQDALTDAQAAQDAADTAKTDADKAKADAEQAAADAEQAAADAQAELERYLNEEVPGTTAVSGTASEAGAHGADAQHAGAFACGGSFVGTRIGDNAAYEAHRTQINERWNAWRRAYHAAKKARKEAEAAANAAEQAAKDTEQARADVEVAEAAAAAAQAAYDAALQALAACREKCAGSEAARAAARAKVEQCRAAGGMPGSGSGGTSGTGGDSGTGTPGAGDSTGGSTDSGDADGSGEDGTGDGPGGGGSGPGGGTTAGPGGPGGQGGDDTRPPGGWPWEQPPPTSTGDEDTDELIKLFEKIASLIKEWEKVKDEFEDNDLVEEVRLYQSIGDLLDNIGELDSEISNALKEFASCNSEPLEELLAKGGEKIDAVIAALGLLKGAIGIYLIIDDDMPASRKAKLEAIKDKLDKACDKLEELKDKGEDAAELASTLAAIKEGEIWPDDVIQWLTDKLEGMLSDAASDLADEIIKKAVEKIVGSKAAGPIISIIKDLCDTADAIGGKLDLDDLDEAITKALLEAIGKADTMSQYHIPCEWEYISGKYVWIAGSPEDWANTEVAFKWEKRCLCSDGTWKTYTCAAGQPTVEDKDGRRYWTFPSINLPQSECKPCIITVDVTIKRGSTQVTHTLLVGVQVCK